MTMTLGEAITELPPSPEHYVIADRIGLSYANAEQLAWTRIHNLGNIVMDTGEQHPLLRVHVGPDGMPHGGGTKWKGYPSRELYEQDTLDHGDSMFWKNFALGMLRGGGKTVSNLNWRAYQKPQLKDAARQTGRLYAEAGLADTSKDRTAADEGTGPYIAEIIEGMRDVGIEHPEVCITGKSDMKTRNPATGRGGAIATRALMSIEGQDEAGFAVQGAGPAGLFYVAEAYEPWKDSDRARAMPVYALGDLDPKTGRPATLATSHPLGLPITPRMATSILEHPDQDDDMIAEGGYKLAALASKIESQGTDVEILDMDVLTYNNEVRKRKVDYLVPAATSNVFTPDNIGDIAVKNIIEIGNHTVRADLARFFAQLGFRKNPGERFNAGGAYVSDLEHLRDLARIRAIEEGVPYIPDSDEVYNDKLHETMTRTTLRDYAIAKAYDVSVEEAVKMVGMASAAVANGMEISDKMRDLLFAEV